MRELGDKNKWGRDRNIRFFFLVLSILSLSFFGIVFSVAINVYLHELGHYVVADFYGLEPEMYINNVVEVGSDGVRMNVNPEAYVRYKNPGDTWTNIFITIAGPLVNLMLFLAFIYIHLIIHKRLSKKIKFARLRRNSKSESRLIRLSLFFDIIFISLAVPSILSVIINLANTPGSDGAYLRELIRQL